MLQHSECCSVLGPALGECNGISNNLKLETKAYADELTVETLLHNTKFKFH